MSRLFLGLMVAAVALLGAGTLGASAQTYPSPAPSVSPTPTMNPLTAAVQPAPVRARPAPPSVGWLAGGVGT